MTFQSIGEVASKVVDQWAWWRAALKSPAEIGKTLMVHDGDPHSGFYVQRSRKEWRDGVPTHTSPEIVAIWLDDDRKYVAAIGAGEHRRSVNAADIWTWVASNPIEHALYAAIDEGGEWPEEFLPKAAEPPEPPKEPEVPPEPLPVANHAPVYGMPIVPTADGSTTLGDNGGPPLGIEIAEKVKAETQLLRALTAEPIVDKDTAEKVGECVNRLLALKKRAEEEHTEAKRPWLEGGRAVDDAYKPSINAADQNVRLGRSCVKTFLDKEQARLEAIARDEARKKQAELERKAREKAELSGTPIEQIEVKQVKPKQVLAKVGAAAGRSLTANQRKYFKAEITDYDALVIALKDDADVRDAVGRVAHRLANTKDAAIPSGMRVVEDTRSFAP